MRAFAVVAASAAAASARQSLPSLGQLVTGARGAERRARGACAPSFAFARQRTKGVACSAVACGAHKCTVASAAIATLQACGSQLRAPLTSVVIVIFVPQPPLPMTLNCLIFVRLHGGKVSRSASQLTSSCKRANNCGLQQIRGKRDLHRQVCCERLSGSLSVAPTHFIPQAADRRAARVSCAESDTRSCNWCHLQAGFLLLLLLHRRFQLIAY